MNKVRCFIACILLAGGPVSGWGDDDSGDGTGSPEPDYFSDYQEGYGMGATPVALEPTHLMLVPTARVLSKKGFVVSFHEFSFGLDRNIQISLCPWIPKTGRLLLGAKFGLRPDLAFGIGISDRTTSFYQFSSTMLGLYGVKSHALSGQSTLYGMVDIQIGNDYYFEVAAGDEYQLSPLVKIMGELALYTHFGRRSTDVDFDANIGLRYTWPTFKPLKIDLGINLNSMVQGIVPWPYIDVSYSSKIR